MNKNCERRLEKIVPPEYDNKNLYTFLRSVMRMSGKAVKRVKWLDDGILLDGKKALTNEKIHANQVISVRLSDISDESEIQPKNIPLNIVYEDRDIIIIDKAPNMPTHPGPGHWDDTLGNALLYHWQSNDVYAVFHPVHRLDKDTSGLMVVAKHAYAQEILKKQLHTLDFHREYMAICDGIPEPLNGTIDKPIARVDESVMLRHISSDGLPAVTHYKTLKISNNRALVRFVLETGRTHQIRVHMKYLNCPLVGDYLYGTENKKLITRTALHSCKLEIIQPVTGQKLSFFSDIPTDMSSII